MVGLSVIVVSFNTKEMTLRCIDSIEALLEKNRIPHEIFVVDNNSNDGSLQALRGRQSSCIKVIQNKENIGYGKANNQALRLATYKYVLFLNSDVVVGTEVDFQVLLNYFEKNPQVGALTVRVNLSSGQMDMASHRGFPTPWRSACYFAGLEKIFGSVPVLNRLFGGYHLTYRKLEGVHEIDSPTGAFYLVPRHLLQELHGFDEDFFMYGEDLDLSYRIKNMGYKILFNPDYTVIHYKYQSGLKNGKDKDVRRRIRRHFYEAMQIFYRKHYEKKYPSFLNRLVYFVIKHKLK